ncbi:MAG TPA: hypothetical protein VIY86_01040 [Pirellulaceae bacterium]
MLVIFVTSFILGVSLLGSLALLSPGFAWAVLGLVGFCLLQYLLWGWWVNWWILSTEASASDHDDRD